MPWSWQGALDLLESARAHTHTWRAKAAHIHTLFSLSSLFNCSDQKDTRKLQCCKQVLYRTDATCPFKPAQENEFSQTSETLRSQSSHDAFPGCIDPSALWTQENVWKLCWWNGSSIRDIMQPDSSRISTTTVKQRREAQKQHRPFFQLTHRDMTQCIAFLQHPGHIFSL